MTLFIHEGKKAEDLFLKDGTLPDPDSTDNAEFKIVLGIIKRLLEAGETDKWNKIAKRCMGVSEETTTGVHRLYIIEKQVYLNNKSNHQMPLYCFHCDQIHRLQIHQQISVINTNYYL